MPIYRILNTNWSLKGYPNPNQPGTGAVVCDSTSVPDLDKWEINPSAGVTTIRHVATGLYAYAQGDALVLTDEHNVPPSSLNWRTVAVGPSDYDYAIWVPGQFAAWTVEGKAVRLQGWGPGIVEQGFTLVPA